MLDFDENPVQFTLRGVRYWLAPLTLDDAAGMSAHAGKSQREQIGAMVDLLASKGRTSVPAWWLRLTRRPCPDAAVRGLSPTQQAKLFVEWTREYRGVGLGESLGSDGSPPSTPTS